jgi:hypothetical protein
MEHYVTLFDSLFLSQGLALHMSMERHLGEYTLWILCVDDEVHETLTRMALPNIRLLKMSDLETEELKRVRPGRTKGEYCWTLTPFSPRFVFEVEPLVQRVTYIDADVWFRKNPAPIFREFDASGKQVLITDHSFAPEYDQSSTSGQYCVQFITFTREGGEIVRKWWEEQCIEWCYNRVEVGKFGDQKYLDDWPERFANKVHVLQNRELLLGPWNATRYPYGNAILWHFHGTRIVTKSNVPLGILCGNYPLPAPTKKYIYEMYLKDLEICIHKMSTMKIEIRNQIEYSLINRIISFLRNSIKIKSQYYELGGFIKFNLNINSKYDRN